MLKPGLATGLTLILLPGMDGTGRLFAPFISALPERTEVMPLAYPADASLDYAALEQRVRAALPADRPFVLLGESFSGPIAISIAARPPPAMVGLILCCSFARNPLPQMRWLREILRRLTSCPKPQWLIRSVLLGRFSTPDLNRRLADALSDVSFAVLRARALQVFEVDVTEELVRVKLPTLYLRASEDRLIPAGVAREIAALRPDTEFATVCGPHFLMQAAPESACAAVVEFASRCSSSTSTAQLHDRPPLEIVQ